MFFQVTYKGIIYPLWYYTSPKQAVLDIDRQSQHGFWTNDQLYLAREPQEQSEFWSEPGLLILMKNF